MTRSAYGPGWASPPGVALEEWRAGRRMSRAELAAELGLSRAELAELVTGRLELTLDLVIRLEDVTGVPRRMWAAMEALYRADLIRQHTLSEDVAGSPGPGPEHSR